MFEYNVESKETYNIFKLRGYLNISSAEKFKSIVNEISKVDKDFIIDLTELTYIDSVGLGIIFDLKKKMDDKTKKIVIFGVCKDIYNVLEVIGVTGNFCIVKSYKDAIELIER